VTRPIVCAEPRSISLVTTAGLRSTHTTRTHDDGERVACEQHLHVATAASRSGGLPHPPSRLPVSRQPRGPVSLGQGSHPPYAWRAFAFKWLLTPLCCQVR